MDNKVHNWHMLSLYSKKCEYVLRGLAQLGRSKVAERFRAADFCKASLLPESFTRKALQSLVAAGILEAVQGPGGGYSFSRSASQISVLEIILAIEGQDHFSVCVMGLKECDSKTPCGLHVYWTQMKKTLLTQLAEERLDSFMRKADKAGSQKLKKGS